MTNTKENNWQPKAMSFEKRSIIFPIPIKAIPNNTICTGVNRLKKVMNFITIDYLKNESTNSYLLNTCKSSIPSPTPIYLTGI